jgi:predicted nucleic acid-binding Zn ribbon protein
MSKFKLNKRRKQPISLIWLVVALALLLIGMFVLETKYL